MKTFKFTLQLIMAFCSISCHQDGPVPVEDGRIQIPVPVVSSSKINRSYNIEQNLPDQAAFGLFGYCVPFRQYEEDNGKFPDWSAGPSIWAIKKKYAHADIFFNQKIIVQKGNICFYTPFQHWYFENENGIIGAERFKYTFFGYYPYEDKKNIRVISPDKAESVGLPVISYTMPFNTSQTSSVLDDGLTDDLLYACSINTLRKDGKLALKFNHAMTGISIKFKSYNRNKIVVIRKAELVCKNFFKKVCLDFSEVENREKYMDFNNSERYSGTYQLLDTKKGVRLEVEESKDRAEYTSSKNILLLTNVGNAKNSLGESAGLELEMEVTDKSSKETSIIRFKDYRLPDTFKAFPGIKYILEVNLADREFVVNIIAKNSEIWDDGGDSDIITE